jgi:putative phosphoesterase
LTAIKRLAKFTQLLMKALILSDIHSNIYALEAIWTQEKDSEILYCTGDLVDYGPYPKEVLDWVRAHNVICVQGNHDRWVVEKYRNCKPFDQIPTWKRLWAHHNADLLDEGDIIFLESLPETITFQIDGINYGMVHLYRDYDEIVSLFAYQAFLQKTFTEPDNSNFSRLILGHTHRQAVRYLSDEILWVNPGSVSYRRPDDPDQTAHYAIISAGVISLKRLPYDLAPLRKYVRGISLDESEIQAAERFFGDR